MCEYFLSAACATAAWIVPEAGAALTLASLVYLMAALTHRPPTWRDGCWLGIGSVGIPLALIGIGAARLLHGSRIMLTLCLAGVGIGVGLVYGTAWWALCRLTQRGLDYARVSIQHGRLIGGAGATLVWWLLIDGYGLCWMGWCEGFPLACPAVPCAAVPVLRCLCRLCGRRGLLTLLIVVGAALVVLWTYRSFWPFVGMGALVLAAWTTLYMYDDAYDVRYACMPYITPLQLSVGPYEDRESMRGACNALCSTPPYGFGATAESAVHPPHSWVTEVLREHAQGDGWFVGGFREDNGRTYNTIWWVCAGELVAWFDKQVIMPGVEFVPKLLKISCVQRACLGAYPELSSGHSRPLWAIGPGMHVVPYVCAEILCATAPRDNYGHAAILALCNDGWTSRVVAERMRMLVLMHAMDWQRTIYYSARHVQMITLPSGASCSL